MKHVYLKALVLPVLLSLGGWACDDSDNDKETEDGTETGEGECDGITDVSVDILSQDIELEGQTVTKTVNTVLMVNWDQTVAADTVKLKFTFEDDEWYASPLEPGKKGAHAIPVLGVPELTDVTIQIVSETDGKTTVCETEGTTGKVPESIPRATVNDFDPAKASANRWMLGTVEKTPEILGMYEGVFTLYIIDRKGRIVWYYVDQAWRPITAYPRIARDGSHVYFDRTTYLSVDNDVLPSIARTTLDFSQFEQIDAPSMTDSMDITDDGGLVYNSDEWLIEQTADGKERQVWQCIKWVEDTGMGEAYIEEKLAFLKYKLTALGKIEKLEILKKLAAENPEKLYVNMCYANSVVFNPNNDSILLSFPYINTVVAVSRDSGEIVGQWGDAPGSWRFEPESVGLEFEHGANITEEGTLLVSTRQTGIEDPYTKPEHYFIEFELDYDNQVATEIWRYGEGLTLWPAVKGEVYPVADGNRLANYGSAGTIRELTPDGEVAWDVKWDTDFEVPPELRKLYDETFTDDDVNNMVGHNILIDDLYALTEGWESK